MKLLAYFALLVSSMGTDGRRPNRSDCGVGIDEEDGRMPRLRPGLEVSVDICPRIADCAWEPVPPQTGHSVRNSNVTLEEGGTNGDHYPTGLPMDQ